MKIAVLMPSKGRPQQLERNAGALLMQPLPNGVEALYLMLAVECDDIGTLAVARKLQTLWQETAVSVSVVLRASSTTAVQGFNLAYVRARGVADWYVLGSDDQVWGAGWLDAALATARETGAQVIGLNDGHTDLEQYAPHFMATGAFIETVMGGLIVPPSYHIWWFDREICERARALGLYAPAWAAVVEHRHPDWGTAAMDATYREAWALHDTDKAIYLSRQAAAWPDGKVNHAS
jgi:hypothetical protein